MTFANPFSANNVLGFVAWLNSITIEFKGTVVSGEYDLALFLASPSGTFTDNTAPAIAIGDTADLVAMYRLAGSNSSLGTHTIYNLDGVDKFIKGATNNLYGVVVTLSGTATALASTTEMTVRLGMNW